MFATLNWAWSEPRFLTCQRLERSRRFYDAALRAVGLVRSVDFQGTARYPVNSAKVHSYSRTDIDADVVHANWGIPYFAGCPMLMKPMIDGGFNRAKQKGTLFCMDQADIVRELLSHHDTDPTHKRDIL